MTVVVGWIFNNDEVVYLKEVENLECWNQENNLLLNGCNTKELIVIFGRTQVRHGNPLTINGYANGEGVLLQTLEDLTWIVHNSALKNAHQHLHLFRMVIMLRLAGKILKPFYTCIIESILTGSIITWCGSCTKLEGQQCLLLGGAFSWMHCRAYSP